MPPNRRLKNAVWRGIFYLFFYSCVYLTQIRGPVPPILTLCFLDTLEFESRYLQILILTSSRCPLESGEVTVALLRLL